MSAARTVKFTDFRKHNRPIEKVINKVFQRFMESGWYILGKEVESFEKEFANYIGTKYGVGVASGTDALTLSLKALDLRLEDGVIVPTNVYPTVFGVALSGVNIQLADIDPKTLNISLQSIKEVVTTKTKAIVIVHLYGNPVDLDPILDFCKKNKLYLIEDCAQAHGATYKGKMTGSFGHMSCFSFYPTKNLGTYGDAGMVLTNNRKYAQILRRLRMYGEEKRYKSIQLGHNSRLDELHAAILREKLKFLDEWNAKRRQLALEYKKTLGGLPIEFAEETLNSQSACHLFVIKTRKRNGLMQFLKSHHIDCVIHYPTNIQQQKTFLHLGGKFPFAEKAVAEILSLPLYPEMNISEIRYVAKTIKEFFGKH